MKVLFVSHSSVVDVYQDKLRYIARTPGIELTVLLPEEYLEGPALVKASLGDGSYRVITRPTRFGRQAKQNLFTFRNLYSVFAEVQPDVLHMEEEPESFVTVQLVRHALRMKKPPKIVAFTWRNQEIPFPYMRGRHPKYYILKLTQQMTLPHIDVLICGTHDSERLIRPLGYSGPMPIIPQYGVNPEVYAPPADAAAVRARLGLPAEATIVGFVGRILKMKGLDVLVDAVASLNRPELHLVLLGSGDYADETARRAQERGLQGRIHFIQGRPAREVPEILGCMDMLCIPSLTTPQWQEQFGRVIIEAMACGVPVIGSDSGEIPYVIGEAGIVTPEGDTTALARAIDSLAGDAERRLFLRRQGLGRIGSTYTNERIAESIVAVYHSLFP